MAEFQEALDRLPCRHLLVILDCCFAGSFRWATAPGTSRRGREGVLFYRQRFDRYLRGRAWQAIASASHRQQALDALARGGFGDRDGHGRTTPAFAAALFAGHGVGRADPIPTGSGRRDRAGTV